MIVMLSGPDKRIGFSKDVKKFLNKELKNCNSSGHSSITYLITYLSIASASSISSSKSANAISGSIIQNSAACLVVLEFSALNVGPKV